MFLGCLLLLFFFLLLFVFNFFGFFLFCFFYQAFFLFYFFVIVCFCFFFSLLGCFFGCCFLCQFGLNSRIRVICNISQRYEPLSFFFDIFLPALFILLFHPPLLISIRRIIQIIFIILTELTPSFEIVPKLIEFVYVI